MDKDIKDMTHEEFQQHWLELARKDAETNKYDAELLRMITEIIDKKDYSHLFYAFMSYDRFVKAVEKEKITDIPEIKEGDLPFWSYCLTFNTKEVMQSYVQTPSQQNQN